MVSAVRRDLAGNERVLDFGEVRPTRSTVEVRIPTASVESDPDGATSTSAPPTSSTQRLPLQDLQEHSDRPRAVVGQSFANDLTSAQAALITATQRPASLVAVAAPSGPPAWKGIPAWAVIGTQDRIITLGAQRQMAEHANARITEVEASHRRRCRSWMPSSWSSGRRPAAGSPDGSARSLERALPPRHRPGQALMASLPHSRVAVSFAPRAGVTQLAECLLPKQDVAGSNPVSRSNHLTRMYEDTQQGVASRSRSTRRPPANHRPMTPGRPAA